MSAKLKASPLGGTCGILAALVLLSGLKKHDPGRYIGSIEVDTTRTRIVAALSVISSGT